MAKLKKDVQGYGRTPNTLLNDNTITLKAKGIFAYMESKPDDWEFSVNKLEHALKESESAISSALKELEANGYLSRKKYQNEKGHWGIEYTLSDKTLTGKTQARENPVQGKPPKHTKKVEPKKNTPNKVTVTKVTGHTPETYGSTDINEMFEYWHKTVGYKLESNRQRNRNACNNLIKKHTVDGLQRLVQGVALANQDRYAPSIADFIGLQAKTNELIAWGKRSSSTNKPKVAII